MTQHPILSVIIVSWNVHHLLKQSLESIYSSWGETPDLEVIVVDNASSDESVAMVHNFFPNVNLIPNDQNLGYPAGCNQGLAAAAGKYLLVLNPDTEIVNDALNTLVRYMDAHPEVGMTGPLLTYPDGSHQSSRRRFPTLPVLFLESTWLQKLAPRSILKRYYMQDIAKSTTQQVDWITGAAMLIRREVWLQVGGFDEGFFMYSEELDWCRRIKKNGWLIMYIPQATVIHHEGKSSEQVTAERHIYFQTSKIRYSRIYHGKNIAFLLHHWIRLQFFVQIFLESIKWVLGHKPELRQKRISVYRQVLRSRFH